MSMITQLKSLPRNQRKTIKMLPLLWWLIPLLTFYLPLYMKSIGINDIQIGTMYTVSNVLGFLFLTVSAPITNKLGRRKTILIFELLSWAVPFALFAIWESYWAFIFGFAFLGLSKIGNVAVVSFLTEGVKEKHHSLILSILNLVYLAPGIITPIFGLLIGRIGIQVAMRWIFAVQVLSVVSAVIIRHIMVEETDIGRNLMNQKLNVIEHIKSSFKNAFESYKNRIFFLAGLLHLGTMMIQVILGAFQGLYISQQVSLTDFQLSIVPAVSGIANLFVFFIILPRLSRKTPELVLIAFIIVEIIAMVILLTMSQGNIAMLILFLVLKASSQFMICSIRDVVIIKSTPSESKSDSYAAIQLITGLIVIPVGTIAGVLFNIHNALPFLAIILINVGMLLIALKFLHILKKSKSAEKA